MAVLHRANVVGRYRYPRGDCGTVMVNGIRCRTRGAAGNAFEKLQSSLSSPPNALALPRGEEASTDHGRTVAAQRHADVPVGPSVRKCAEADHLSGIGRPPKHFVAARADALANNDGTVAAHGGGVTSKRAAGQVPNALHAAVLRPAKCLIATESVTADADDRGAVVADGICLALRERAGQSAERSKLHAGTTRKGNAQEHGESEANGSNRSHHL